MDWFAGFIYTTVRILQSLKSLRVLPMVWLSHFGGPWEDHGCCRLEEKRVGRTEETERSASAFHVLNFAGVRAALLPAALSLSEGYGEWTDGNPQDIRRLNMAATHHVSYLTSKCFCHSWKTATALSPHSVPTPCLPWLHLRTQQGKGARQNSKEPLGLAQSPWLALVLIAWWLCHLVVK